MNSKILEYRPSLKTFAGRNLMEYFFSEDEIIAFELEMLIRNNIPGLLQSEAIRVDGSIRLSFCITSLIPLKKLLERREIGREDFLHILKQMVSLSDRLEEYLLSFGGIAFDSQLIFVNPQNLKLEFAYLPIREMSQSLDALKSYLLDMIIRDIRFSNNSSDNFVQRLIELLKTEELRTEMLKDYINNMESSSFVQDKVVNEIQSKEVRIKEDSKQPKEKETQIKTPITPQERQINESSKKTGYPAKSYVILFSIIAAFVLFGVVLSFTETFSIDNPDFLLSLFGYLMIGGALCYLVYSKLFTPDKKIELTYEKKEPKIKPPVAKSTGVNIPGIAINKTIGHKERIPSNGMVYVNKTFTPPGYVQGREAAAPGLVSKLNQTGRGFDRTVILDPGRTKFPSLKGVKANASETIIMTHFPFMIGRLEDQVDYCIKNPAIGKIQAEIKKTDDGYYLADMNSRNGTHINNERLEPSKEYKLENGTHITFANEEFIFWE